MNVRFFVGRHVQCLQAGLKTAGIDLAHGSRPEQTVHNTVRLQHLRFLAEARIATPLSGYFGVVELNGSTLVVTEIRHSFTEQVLCSCVHTLEGLDTQQFAVQCQLASLAEHSGSRGVPNADLGHTSLTLTSAADYGFRDIGLGLVQPQEADRQGNCLLETYMGRLSDSMPHLWDALRTEAGLGGENEGGAVLEYRLRYHMPLQVGQRFRVMSGLLDVTGKVQRFAHLMFNPDTGELLVSAETAGVRMDLIARKAKQLAPEVLAALERLKLRTFE